MKAEVRSLSRMRGRVGVGVLPQNVLVEWIDFPHPPRSDERVDLPRKRERCKRAEMGFNHKPPPPSLPEFRPLHCL